MGGDDRRSERERGRRVWGLWPGFCELGQNPGRTNQIAATLTAGAMSHDFRIERVTRLGKALWEKRVKVFLWQLRSWATCS